MSLYYIGSIQISLVSLAVFTHSKESNRLRRYSQSSSSGKGSFTPKYQAIDSILHSPWWSRLWTLQEQQLATRCDILHGRYAIPWNRFEMAIHMNYHISEMVPLNLETRFHVTSSFKRVRDDHPGFRASTTFASGQALFSATFHLLAKNPLDKIYSLHSMLSKCGIPLGNPDYSKSPEQLYEETAWSWIESHQDLSILQIAANREPVKGLPSWVPAWHKPRDIDEEKSFSWNLDGYHLRLKMYAGHSNFFALHSPGELHLRGRYLGRITYDGARAWKMASEPTHHPDTLQDTSITMYQMWCRRVWKHSRGADLGQFDLMLGQMFETLVNPFLRNDPGSDFSAFRRWFEIMIYPDGSPGPWTSKVPADVLSTGDQVAPTLGIGKLPSYLSKKPKTDWIQGYINLTWVIHVMRDGFSGRDRRPEGRFFFLLDTGMMGVARPWFQYGDDLFLFPGSDCPFILRRDGGSHRLVAPAHMARVTEEELSNFDGKDMQEVTLI